MIDMLHWLAGTWHIVRTNFPMWTKGDKKSPTFTYSITHKDGQPLLLDEVRYSQGGKAKTITGFDRPNPNDDTAFTWRGKGLLVVAKSEWKIKLFDEAEEWAVIYFSKTLFTPEGVDIISRTPSLDAPTLQSIEARMLEDDVLKKHVGTLVTLPR